MFLILHAKERTKRTDKSLSNILIQTQRQYWLVLGHLNIGLLWFVHLKKFPNTQYSVKAMQLTTCFMKGKENIMSTALWPQGSFHISYKCQTQHDITNYRQCSCSVFKLFPKTWSVISWMKYRSYVEITKWLHELWKSEGDLLPTFHLTSVGHLLVNY